MNPGPPSSCMSMDLVCGDSDYHEHWIIVPGIIHLNSNNTVTINSVGFKASIPNSVRENLSISRLSWTYSFDVKELSFMCSVLYEVLYEFYNE